VVETANLMREKEGTTKEKLESYELMKYETCQVTSLLETRIEEKLATVTAYTATGAVIGAVAGGFVGCVLAFCTFGLLIPIIPACADMGGVGGACVGFNEGAKRVVQERMTNYTP
jgi:uncharacterized membrane protein